MSDIQDQAAAFIEELSQRQADAWYSQPRPRRWHRCRAAQAGRAYGRFVERCACGGIRFDGRVWMERNSRS